MPDQKTTVTTSAAVKPPDTPKPTASKTPLPSVPALPVEKKPQEQKVSEKKSPVAESKAADPSKTDQKPQAENISSKKAEQPERPAPEAKVTAAAEKKPETPKAEKPVAAPAKGIENKPAPPAAAEKKSVTPPKEEKKPEPLKTVPAPLGVHITRIFDDRLDKPDENALKALPVPQEGDGFSMRLHPDYFFDFLDHPFSVNREVQDYKDLFESIKATGINEPVKARPREGGGLELLSGHRRHDIAKQLGYPVPVVIVQEDEDTARIEVVDGNLHRQDIPTSELARAAKMKMDALARKAGRRSKLEQLAQPQKRTDQIVAEDMGMSRNQVNRLVRINSLVPELKQQVDDKKLPFNTAVELSFLKPQEQSKVVDFMKKEQVVPSMAQATALKEASRAAQEAQKPAPQNPMAPAPKQPAPAKAPAPVDEKKIASIVKTKEPPEIKYTFTSSELKEYFPKDYQPTVSEVKRKVFDALDLQKRQKEREAAKNLAKKGAER